MENLNRRNAAKTVLICVHLRLSAVSTASIRLQAFLADRLYTWRVGRNEYYFASKKILEEANKIFTKR